jgi:hypothetical protein
MSNDDPKKQKPIKRKIISDETCKKANDFRLTCQAVAVFQARSRTQAQVGCGDKSRGAPERQLFPLLAAFGKLTNPNHGGLVLVREYPRFRATPGNFKFSR